MWQVQQLHDENRIIFVLYEGGDEAKAREVYENVRNSERVDTWFALVQVNTVEMVLKQARNRPEKFGPKAATHPSIGEQCPACSQEFVPGDFTTLIALGPGPSKEARQRALEGRPYNAVAVEVHWTCATGEET